MELSEELIERLPPQAVRKIAVDLSLSEVGRWCQVSTKFNNAICENDEFWRLKIRKDFPGVSTSKLKLEHMKNKYKELDLREKIKIERRKQRKYSDVLSELSPLQERERDIDKEFNDLDSKKNDIEGEILKINRSIDRLMKNRSNDLVGLSDLKERKEELGRMLDKIDDKIQIIRKEREKILMSILELKRIDFDQKEDKIKELKRKQFELLKTIPSPGKVVKVIVSEDEYLKLSKLLKKISFHPFFEIKEILGEKVKGIKSRDLIWINEDEEKPTPDILFYFFRIKENGKISISSSGLILRGKKPRFPPIMYDLEGPREYLIWKYGVNFKKEE